jgi:hypothetical protein
LASGCVVNVDLPLPEGPAIMIVDFDSGEITPALWISKTPERLRAGARACESNCTKAVDERVVCFGNPEIYVRVRGEGKSRRRQTLSSIVSRLEDTNHRTLFQNFLDLAECLEINAVMYANQWRLHLC